MTPTRTVGASRLTPDAWLGPRCWRTPGLHPDRPSARLALRLSRHSI